MSDSSAASSFPRKVDGSTRPRHGAAGLGGFDRKTSSALSITLGQLKPTNHHARKLPEMGTIDLNRWHHAVHQVSGGMATRFNRAKPEET
jgi:hypothetical protein